MKKHLLLKNSISILIFLLISTCQLLAQITVNSNFEGGNGVATFTDNANNEVHIVSELKGGDTKNISFYVEVTGLNSAMPLTLQVSAQWSGHTIVYSYDNITWEKSLITNINNFIVPLNSTSVFIAHSYPYTYSNMIADVNTAASSSHVNVFDMAISEEGRPVKLVKITDDCVDDAEKELIWIFGRMHAFELPGNHAVVGMLDFFTSNHPKAERIRKEAIIYIVPMMDVDQAYNGGSGKDQTPADFNRDWGLVNIPSHWNAVNGAKSWIDSTAQLNNFSVFFESHSPPPSHDNTSLFYYIYEHDHHIPNTRFVTETIQYLGGYQGEEELYSGLYNGISQDYIIINYDNPKHYNVTMETGFKKRGDGVMWTKELYLLNGEFHAIAISDYIHGFAVNNDILIDNNDVSNVVFNGNWISDTTVLGYFGNDYMYADTVNPASVIFNATIDTAGTYEVFTRWVSNPDFATNALATFNYSGGSSDFILDMSLRGGNWLSLAVFEFEAGEQVSLTINNANANQKIIADGLRISKVEPCESLANMEIKQTPFDLILYPNPTSGFLNSVDNGINFEQIVIIDVTGKKVKTITSFDNGIDVSDLSNGIFIIQFVAKEGVITKRFVKE